MPRYNAPDKGTLDWAGDLNQNWRDLAIEVPFQVETREDLPDPDSDIVSSNGSTRTAIVLEEGALVRDNGEEWESLIQSGRGGMAVPGGGVPGQVPGGRAIRGPPSDGLIRGINGRGESPVTADPSEYASADRAIQDVINQAESDGDGSARIEIPHTDPSGNELVIRDTVVHGRQGDSYPVFVGATGQKGPYIQVEIDDGSCAFEVIGQRLNGTQIGGAHAEAGGNNCGFIRLYRTVACTYHGGDLRAFNGPGAICLDSRSWNGRVQNVNFNGRASDGRKHDVSDMSCIRFLNADGDGTQDRGPGEWIIQGITTYAAPDLPFDSIIRSDVNASAIRVRASRFEGAGGRGLVDFRGGGLLVSDCEIGRAEGGADGIHFTGFSIVLGPNIHEASKDVGYYVDGARGRIQNATRYSNVNTAIEASGPGSGKLVVPHPDTVEDPVRYSNTANMYYPDGSQP